MPVELGAVSALLARHKPADDIEAAHLRQAVELAASARACDRAHYTPGHFTASAFVRAGDGRLGLILHPKLGFWLQPGGHIEPEDGGLAGAAARELAEETGLRADPAGGIVLDIDVHQFPARGGDPAHLHFDLRFLFTAYTPGAAHEAHAFRWAAPRDLLADASYGDSMKRAVRKAMTA